MAYSKRQLMDDLKKMGLLPTDTVMVHSSMKSLGEVEGGADTVVDAFIEYFQDGLFMTPAHTWAQMSDTYSLFDPETEPACVGIIPNRLLARPGRVRSLHPTHSVAAYGVGAAEYVKGEENATTPCPTGGCWDRLRQVGAKILLVGVTHARNTYIHSIEEAFAVPNRLTGQPTAMQIQMPDGSLKEVAMHRHTMPHGVNISEHFVKMTEIFYDKGAAKKGKLGDADCILCDAQRLFEVVGRILQHDAECIVEMEEIPMRFTE